MISLLVCCLHTAQSDLFKTWVRSHLMVSCSHTEWNLPLYRDLQALNDWLPEPCLPPPSRSLKLQSHWLPPCPGEHPTFRFTAACTQNCFFLVWTVSCLTLSFNSGLCSKSTSPSGEPSLITLSKPLSLLSFTLLCFYLDYALYLQRGGL